MRSLQITLADLPMHNEENPNLSHPRHPIVVYSHLAYISLLAFVFLVWTEKTAGQTLYFLITIGLYTSSAAYHTWRPNRFLRFVDQTMISWFTIVIWMPFLYQEFWALPLFAGIATLTAMCKWYQWEPNYKAESMIFFTIGATSALMVIVLGLPVIGVGFHSMVGFWILVTIVLFIAKLVIYYFQFSLIRDVIESPELGHAVLWVPVTIFTTIVVLYPV